MTRKLTTTELAILGLLSSGERSGYDLHRRVELSVGLMWKPARSQIYAVLPRLVERGYATRRSVSQDARPDKQLYRITDQGEQAVRDWVDEPPRGPEKDFQLKIFFGRAAPVERAIERVEAARRRNVEHIERLNAIERDALAEADPADWFPLLTLRLGRAHSEAFVAWADEVLPELVRRRDLGAPARLSARTGV